MNFPVNIPEYQVSQLNRAMKEVIESNFDYVRIRGEISEVKIATRGQYYLTLKDNDSILSGVIWDQKIKFLNLKPEKGMEIIATGKITTWSKYKTTYQIDIDTIELAGQGALLKLIEDRKKKLEDKGLFDEKLKKQIPFLPSKIGVITSPTGSVVYDIINRIKDRFYVNIDVWPTAVQGVGAAESIVNAINGFNKMQSIYQPDVIIIARGGGSTEDLMTFNEESLAYAVFESKIPIITAIGHETDTTIVDYVSDLRASTPTAAAEKAVPVKKDLIKIIETMDKRINFLIKEKLKLSKFYLLNLDKFLKAPNLIIKTFKNKIVNTFNELNSSLNDKINTYVILLNSYNKIIKPPLVKLELNKSQLKNLSKNINKYIDENQFQSKQDLSKLTRLLSSNSISSNLKKGYSILTKKNKVIKNSKNLIKNDEIKANLYQGSIELIVKKIN